MKYRLLVIGYGNELRHDDAVGPRAARTVSSWQAPGVKAIAVQQLTPELAEMLADTDAVVFVDAGHDASETLCNQLLEPAYRAVPFGHLSDPSELLALAAALYQRRPEAWLLTVPAPDLGHGEGLSAVAARGLATALEQISLLDRDLRLQSPETTSTLRCE